MNLQLNNLANLAKAVEFGKSCCGLTQANAAPQAQMPQAQMPKLQTLKADVFDPKFGKSCCG